MRWVFAFIVAIHGLIHLMGPAKAFGYADLPHLAQPISSGMGLVWLAAAALAVAAAVALFVWPRGWWMIGAAALVLSQAVIVTSWSDASAGTVANVLLLAGVAYGYFTQGPASFRAQFERDVRTGPAPLRRADHGSCGSVSRRKGGGRAPTYRRPFSRPSSVGVRRGRWRAAGQSSPAPGARFRPTPGSDRRPEKQER